MTKLNQNDFEYIKDQMDIGNLSADQANVEMVKAARVRVINGSMPASVRKALNAAVKSGELGHKAKSNNKPEVYYHLSFEHLANAERSRIERETLNALMSVCC